MKKKRNSITYRIQENKHFANEFHICTKTKNNYTSIIIPDNFLLILYTTIASHFLTLNKIGLFIVHSLKKILILHHVPYIFIISFIYLKHV